MKAKLLKRLCLIFLFVFVSCAGGQKKESTGQYFDSAAVTAKIKGLYLKDERLSSFDVKVETYKGVVQLSGFVKTAAEKKAAEEIAFSVVGVEKVTNNILIRNN